MKPRRIVLVTGTGTEVGKTWVAERAVAALREMGQQVVVRKPAQSFAPGATETDADRLARASGESATEVCPRHRWYPRAMAPPMAAEALGLSPPTLTELTGEIDSSWPAHRADVGVVEGAGGVASPLAGDGDNADLARALTADRVVVVADAGLGTINAVRLATRALVPLAVAVYLNRLVPDDDLHRHNRRWLEERDGLTVAADLPELLPFLVGGVGLICARFDDLTPGGTSFALARPVGTLEATQLGQVQAVLEAAAAAARDGAWVAGFVAYEAAPAFDPALTVAPAATTVPLAWFGLFAERSEIPAPNPDPAPAPGWRLGWDSARHAAAVDRIKEHLAAGDTYQVNLTVRATTSHRQALQLYAGMARAQGGSYHGFLDTGTHAVACASPELFFAVDGGHIVTRPMKGTRRRGRWGAEDDVLRRELTESGKDQSEHVMIVDLVRNDLGRIAVPGTVRVDTLSELEPYPTVWQLTSTIGADLSAEIGLVDIFRALFPCGSVTGAPKPRTMQIIAALEGTPRRVYCGAVGYLAPGSPLRARFAVAIRTATIHLASGSAEYGTGGGITWESDPTAEWLELQTKCAVLQARPPPSGLVETFAGGSANVPRHLDRLSASAAFLGIPFDRADADRLASTKDAVGRRVRLLLGPRGRLELQVGDLPAPTPASGPVRLGLAGEAVDSRDTDLFHKCLDRSRYDRARSQRPDLDDVILYNERDEVTETTIANLAIRLDGQWCTPPVACGLLAGIERCRLIETGVLRERVVTIGELVDASGLATVSSLRGWRPAVLCLE